MPTLPPQTTTSAAAACCMPSCSSEPSTSSACSYSSSSGNSSNTGSLRRHHNGNTTADNNMATDDAALINGGGLMNYALDNNNLAKFEESLSMRNVRPVDIKFKDVRYDVLDVRLMKMKIGRKEILHGVSGHFRAGQLTAIMGPSGAGKSSLLNVLAGYVNRGVSGSIEMKTVDAECINTNADEKNRNKYDSSSSCRYIHQDDKLRPWMTVQEAMTLAAALKLDRDTSNKERELRISELLSALGLKDCRRTLTGRLSGGQRKRLAIALEMISDPAVLYLDEPTTGLDSSSCTHCVHLLRRLARQGRTIVCTVHQPSALLFDRFDQVYMLVEGHAFYRGTPRGLGPFLAACPGALRCPEYHNPADFMMEIATGEYGADIPGIIAACSRLYALQEQQEALEKQGIESPEKLALLKEVESLGGCVEIELASQVFKGDFVNNQLKLKQRQQQQQQRLTINNDAITTAIDDDDDEENCNQRRQSDSKRTSDSVRQPSWLKQFALLYKRQLIAETRNYSLPLLRLAAHLLIGVLFGYLYSDVGDNADSVLANYIYLYGTMLLLVYTGKMSVTLNFPLEMETLAREYFNRWYNIGPYYIAVILIEIPFQILCALIYITSSYYLTGNLVDWFRIGCFVGTCILGTLCGQSWGYFIGASTPVKIAVFLGPVIAVLFSVFGFCLWYSSIPYALRWLYHLSYFRAAFQGLVITIYGFNRTVLPCPTDMLYCHYKYAKRFLMEADALDVDLTANLCYISGTIVLMHCVTIIVIWMKLNKR